MKVLVIGCHGFIGTHLKAYLQKLQYEVIGADVKPLNNETFVLDKDVNNLHVLLQNHKFDFCINASGSATVAFSLEHEEEDALLNYKNVVTMLQAFEKYQNKCKFINLSSAAVYGNPIIFPVNEQCATNPISPYGKHKMWSEHALTKYALEKQMQTLSLRIFSVYGNGLKKQLFWDIYLKTLLSDEIELFGHGSETRDFIHISDLLEAIQIIMHHAKFDGTAINVASGVAVSINNAAHTLTHYLSSKINITFSGKVAPENPIHWLADISKLKQIGFRPKITLQQGLKNYAAWLKELN